MQFLDYVMCKQYQPGSGTHGRFLLDFSGSFCRCGPLQSTSDLFGNSCLHFFHFKFTADFLLIGFIVTEGDQFSFSSSYWQNENHPLHYAAWLLSLKKSFLFIFFSPEIRVGIITRSQRCRDCLMSNCGFWCV